MLQLCKSPSLSSSWQMNCVIIKLVMD